MFFDSQRIKFMREMILANSEEEKKSIRKISALSKKKTLKIFLKL